MPWPMLGRCADQSEVGEPCKIYTLLLTQYTLSVYSQHMNTSIRFQDAYTAHIDINHNRYDDASYTNENRPSCYAEISHLAARALRMNRKTGRRLFSMTHKGYRASITVDPNVGIWVNTSVVGLYEANYWFTVVD